MSGLSLKYLRRGGIATAASNTFNLNVVINNIVYTSVGLPNLTLFNVSY